MKKLKEKLAAASEDQHEETLRKAIRAKIDMDLRKELQSDLLKDYGITRSGRKGTSKTLRLPFRIVGIAATLAVLIFATLWLIPGTQNNPEILAARYLEEPMMHPGLTKGNAEADETRSLAINAFNQGHYAQAIELYRSLTDRKEEDQFYLGLSLLKVKEFDDSFEILQNLYLHSSLYKDESRWYLILALIMNHRSDEAKKLLLTFGPEDWKSSEAKELLAALD